MAKVGIIGGSGLYNIKEINNIKWVKIETPFGSPSDEYLTGELSGVDIVFLPRHGRGHTVMPTELNYPANIYGMKKLGVENILSVSAVGSFKKEIKPLDILIPDQYVDKTNQSRKTTFFGDGAVAHINFADPSCGVLSDIVYQAAKKIGLRVHKGGTYLNMEGPAFSTRAESKLHKSWGMDVIGMTNMPEARCAREAEICYVTIAMVTDYDSWNESESVDVDIIIKNSMKNSENAKNLIKECIVNIPEQRKCKCATALKDAVITRSNFIPKETKDKLQLIIGKYLK